MQFLVEKDQLEQIQIFRCADHSLLFAGQLSADSARWSFLVNKPRSASSPQLDGLGKSLFLTAPASTSIHIVRRKKKSLRFRPGMRPVAVADRKNEVGILAGQERPAIEASRCVGISCVSVSIARRASCSPIIRIK